MPSQTNEQALESTIEKRLSGISLEEIREKNLSLDIVNERAELYRSGNGYLALDSGCLWGRELTAVRLQDRSVFQVPCRAGED